MAAGFNTLATLQATLPITTPPAKLPSMPPPSPTEETGLLVLRFGTAVGLAAAAAMACALPAALRVGPGLAQDGTGRVWTGLAAASLVPMVSAVVVLRGAREGLRAFGGPEAELRAYGVALWASSLLVALTLLGSVLRAATHQHALAGVTFAFGALGMAIGLALVCVRLVAILRGASAAVRGGLALALAMVIFAALGWIGDGISSCRVARCRVGAGRRDGRGRPRLRARRAVRRAPIAGVAQGRRRGGPSRRRGHRGAGLLGAGRSPPCGPRSTTAPLRSPSWWTRFPGAEAGRTRPTL